jgi:hypothetical protein
MRQEINFYRRPPSAGGLRLDALAMAWATLALLLLCAVISAVGFFRNQHLSRQLSESQAAMAAAETRVNALRLSNPEPSVDPALVALTDRLQGKVDGLRVLLSQVEGQEWHQRGGFSPYFEGLARRRLDDLWLTSIRLKGGGKNLELIGKALNSEKIPQLVQSLGSESSFRNKSFADLIIRRGEEAEGPVEFTLRTSAFEDDPNG